MKYNMAKLKQTLERQEELQTEEIEGELEVKYEMIKTKMRQTLKEVGQE